MPWIIAFCLFLTTATFSANAEPHDENTVEDTRSEEQKSAELKLNNWLIAPEYLANVSQESLAEILEVVPTESAVRFSKTMDEKLTDPDLRRKVVLAQYVAVSQRVLKSYDSAVKQIAELDPSFKSRVQILGEPHFQRVMHYTLAGATVILVASSTLYSSWNDAMGFYLPNLLGTPSLNGVGKLALLPLGFLAPGLGIVNALRIQERDSTAFHRDSLRKAFDKSRKEAQKEQVDDASLNARVYAIFDRPRPGTCARVLAAVLPNHLSNLLIGTGVTSGVFAVARLTPWKGAVTGAKEATKDWYARRKAVWEDGSHAIENLTTDLDSNPASHLVLNETAHLVTSRMLASEDRQARLENLFSSVQRYDASLKSAGKSAGLGFSKDALATPEAFIAEVNAAKISSDDLVKAVDAILAKEYQERHADGETGLTPRDLLAPLLIRGDR